MIRISVYPDKNGTIVCIDGRMAGEDLAEVRHVRASLTGDVYLNLGGLLICPPEGFRELRSWLDAGALLQEATQYVRMMLESDPEVTGNTNARDKQLSPQQRFAGEDLNPTRERKKP